MKRTLAVAALLLVAAFPVHAWYADSNSVVNLILKYGGGGGTNVWTSSGSTIYPNGSSGTVSGWVSNGYAIYPQ